MMYKPFDKSDKLISSEVGARGLIDSGCLKDSEVASLISAVGKAKSSSFAGCWSDTDGGAVKGYDLAEVVIDSCN